MARLLPALALVFALVGCAASPVPIPTPAQIAPFVPDAVVYAFTGKPIASHVYAAGRVTGCDKFESPRRRQRCEDRKTGPRSRNYCLWCRGPDSQ